MKRLFITLVATVLSISILTACGETERENIAGEIRDDNNSEEMAHSEENNDEDSEVSSDEENVTDNEINEVIADGDVKATLVKITKESDSIFGDSYKIEFEIENNLDHEITAQARSVSVDGMMVDDVIQSMSQDVAPGKKAKAVLTIEDFDGYDFPEMNEDFEMILHLFSFDNMDYVEDYDVKVDF